MSDSKRFPEINSPSRPGTTSAALAGTVGKTVASVEFGNETPSIGASASEAVVIHFSDGSSVAVVAGPRARSLAKAGGTGIDLEVVWKEEGDWKDFDEVIGM